MTPGDMLRFFRVEAAKEGVYWVGSADDRHLAARFIVLVEPLEQGLNRFHVATTVHHRHWTGPVYFNLIRPFHHLLVGRMVRQGAAAQPTA